MSAEQSITIRGAREHNLKDITVVLPRNKLICITGLSGSGKSSLAFDTLYAEGQRRYVESLSAYARQFLGQMEKPDVDGIDGLSPAISIDQKTTSRNPRSTVGTVTEIYDYLRLLYARCGRPHCPICRRAITGQSAEQIVEQILRLPEDTKFTVDAPIVRGRKGEFKDVLERLRGEGFTRVKVDGETLLLEDEIVLDKKFNHDIAVVVDRLKQPTERRRLTDSVETALQLADGLLDIAIQDGETLTFSERFACPDHGVSLAELAPRVFSFNSPHGACAHCHGLGSLPELDPTLVEPDASQSLNAGALQPWNVAGTNFFEQLVTAIAERFEVNLDTPWGELTDAERALYMEGTDGERIMVSYKNRYGRKRAYSVAWEGLLSSLKRRYDETDSQLQKDRIEEWMAMRPCPECDGARLKPESLAVTVGGLSIYEATNQSVEKAIAWSTSLELTETERLIAERIFREIVERLTFLKDVGVGYLSLNRPSSTLSGGEAQRIRLATQIGSSLVGVLYILDEPSIGLHQRDNQRLLETLTRLRDIGNTVIVVEHDEDTMRAADWLVDMGPGAGEHGGRIVVSGSYEELIASTESITGAYLSGRKSIEIPKTRRAVDPKRQLVIKGAKENNLKDVEVSIPLGLFVSVTGVSGSGKSTLVNDILYTTLANKLNGARLVPGRHRTITGIDQLDKVVHVDQSPIGRTPRSNPATYTGVFDKVRALFAETTEAKVRGYQQGRFSFNVKGGRCENCSGDGTITIEMNFLPDVYVPCEVCHGARYNRETLEVHYKGKTIAEVLDMPIEIAHAFFESVPTIARYLKTLCDVGLGYVRLGQSAPTLSGGEAQRVKLATELQRRSTGRTIYVLDEPTTGLHFEDVNKLLGVLKRLVESGNTVIVIEHNLDVIKSSDWVIDMGPEGGFRGGTVVAEGTPEDVAKVKASYTGQYLAEVLATNRAIVKKSPAKKK